MIKKFKTHPSGMNEKITFSHWLFKETVLLIFEKRILFFVINQIRELNNHIIHWISLPTVQGQNDAKMVLLGNNHRTNFTKKQF